jgi:hypothetical protein
MVVDINGLLRGGFSSIFAGLPIDGSIQAAPANKNCKGADCGVCKKGCVPQ